VSFNPYFQRELLALKELGQDFSRKNPALAPFLSQDGRDPDVERLFEGFAFIAGRLRQKIDDELPELSHSLLQLLWPNYLHPTPSFGMVEFNPVHQANRVPVIPKKAEMRSNAVGHAVSGQFQTCYETELQPLQIADVNYYPQGDAGVLQIELTPITHVAMADVALSTLRLHFAGEHAITSSLYFSLLQLTVRALLVLKDEQGQVLEQFTLDRAHIRPVGFQKEERLQDYPLNCFDGYLLLQEYFCFPQKFLFVDVGGFAVLQHSQYRQQAHRVALQFELSRSPMLRFQPKKEHVRLYCSPISNIFKSHAVPIRYDQRQTEYQVIPAENGLDSGSILSIDSVTGWTPGDVGMREFSQFESFRQQGVADNSACFRVRYKPGINHHGTETWLSFTNQQVGRQQAETISVEMTCCDHTLSQYIKEGDIAIAADGMPQYAVFRNITPLSSTYPPPISGDTLWRIISNMSLNYQSLADVQALRVVLATYDFPGFYDDKQARRSRKMLEGVQQVSQQAHDKIWQGLPVRGMCTTIAIDAAHFLCEGDMFLFASMLNEFFCSFSSLNTFHQLVVTSSDGATYRWAPRMGQQVLN
jgi:type VI secretion system protein ImpG